MVAIYARQSIEKEDSISIESQINACRNEAKREEVKIFSDCGYSGKNTERPGFIEMMRYIETGVISKVIVYKLDRISRSLLDFSTMYERFQKYNVEFVSCTEKFDTSEPMGRAMLSITAVFAQLERETIQSRIIDTYHSRSKKSFFMGGRVPYGFRLKPTIIDGIHTSMFLIEPDEAEQIKLIYQLYSNPLTSYGDIVEYFKEHNITKRGVPWQRPRIADILKNPVYVRADLEIFRFFSEKGVNIINPSEHFIGTYGCYFYSSKDSKGHKQTNLKGNILVIAPHEGLIDSDTWLKCRAKCLNAKQIKRNTKAKNTWLAGKIKCGKCGYALVDKLYHDYGSRRYLICTQHSNAKACVGAGTLRTDDIENKIFAEIKRKLNEFKTLGPQKIKTNTESTELAVEISKIDKEINSLMERVADADDTLFNYINKRINELDSKKQDMKTKLALLMQKVEFQPEQLTHHVENWDKLNFDDRRIVVDQLIKAIYLTSEDMRIEWRI